MSFDQVVKIIELLLTVIGLVIALFGWIVPYQKSMKENLLQNQFEQEMMKKRWEKEHIDAQISEFYGPIAELTRESTKIFELVIKQINAPLYPAAG